MSAALFSRTSYATGGWVIKMASQDGRILCVGSLCLDIINICERYPKEDEDIRAKDQKWQKGGNATNTCHVLRMLNRECELLTTMGRGVEAE